MNPKLTIFFSSIAFQKELVQTPIVIKDFKGAVKIAQKVILESNDIIQEIKELERLIRAKIKNTNLHMSNMIVIEFLNKDFVFTIKSIDATTPSNVAEQMAQLKIKEEDIFYHVEQRTIVEIAFEGRTSVVTLEMPSLENIGGLDHLYDELHKTMQCSVNNKERNLNKMKSFRGVLLYGLPGCGKTLLAETAAKAIMNARKIRIEAWKIFSKFYGESEENLRKLFNEAFQAYEQASVIIIDEITNICPKNDSSDVVRKVSALLISLIDSLNQRVEGSRTFIIATTSNLDNVNPALRRSGRLDLEIEVPVPNIDMRKEIIRKKLVGFPFTEDTVNNLAKLTHGYVGADIEKLIEKSRKLDRNEDLSVNDIFANLSSVKPSAMRELLIEKPNVKWSDIGGMHELKRKLQQIIEWPLSHPEAFQRLGINPPSGLLMFGAPGCSKTMIAKALAAESNLNFISIKGSDLFSMWVGESEKAVRNVFIKARQLSPCIIFFDEIDAIGSERESGSSVKERVLAQILTEIDGVNELKNVVIIAATNRPDLIDTALMRPGRLDRIVYVKLPDHATRREIFNIKLRNVPLAQSVNVDTLVNNTEGYSGAEIEAICKEAGLKALEDSLDATEISMECFDYALKIIKPRTSPELLKIYEEYEKRQ